jgi:aspartyl-tRNA(Asn)/glutamyl-tRNA(Gln) amidotransferase subunit B
MTSVIEGTSLIQGETGDWEVVIGLEVHAQVVSNAKLFSGASAQFGAEPNTQVSFVDAAFPGMLPVINEYCVEQAVRTGLGLKAQINLFSVFDRKNYFYADLPSGYQISQFQQPIVGKGEIVLDMPDGSSRTVGVTRLHLEMDAGKSLHDQHPSRTYVDLNRSGVALMEIVSEPDMRSAEEAAAYVRKLRAILRYLGTCDGNMEEGSMRCDVNVSVRRPGGPLGTRTETKNVNSIRYVQMAIEYETRRQIEVLEEGGTIVQETRLWDTTKFVTRSMRSKEEAHDYRYFPEPDLPPLVVDAARVERVRSTMPELPVARSQRFISAYAIPAYDAGVLTQSAGLADYFEETAKAAGNAKAASNWIMGEVLRTINDRAQTIADVPISPQALAALIALIDKGTISSSIAKGVFATMYDTGRSADEIVREEGLAQIGDEGAVSSIIADVMQRHADAVAQYRSGKRQTFGFLVGQVMKDSGGKANPKLASDLLKRALES